MRRAGVLLLGAVPLIAAGVYFVVPADPGESGGGAETAAAAPAPTSREDAKGRAERERAADDALIAGLPPGLAAPAKKELAQRLVSSAENSTTEWRTAYGTIEDLGDGDGYTAGIIGFCTGTHDLLTLVERYTEADPDNGLAAYLPALREVDGTDSHEGLDPGFTAAWRAEAEVPAFREAQEEERDRVYFDPAVRLAKLDGLGTLGQFVYYDAMVFHGPDTDAEGFYGLRERAMAQARTPARDGSEKAYLAAFLDVRRQAMEAKRPGIDTSRVDTAQRRFLAAGNLKLETPLEWEVYGDAYRAP
ncbi:chitosanase [Streptomyces parvulus]|uniref:Chitosanase n=1 Tax=Streptomyces parvulus TaxID=146923 RepID=A0ABV5DGS9_9ACTN|nr:MULTISPECIES: chitosanase [Streptomyces]MCC9157296.1 chitosanase [Streptomyces parvulus]MCE7688913.1 chitosanase [Streptomyces parvulus]WHM33478.1 chitosanase [Streptomyces sp. BPPL-273]